MRFRIICRALPLVVVVSLFGSSALAQAVDDTTRNAARSLASQGKDAFEKADYEHARDLFHRAYTLVPAPTIALFEGRALAKLRRLVEAEEAYMRAARTPLDADSPEPFRKAVHDADDDLLALRARIAKVTIIASGPGASDPELSVTLDGHTLKSALVGVELPIDPGEHSLSAVAPGGAPVQIAFSAAEKQAQKIEIAVPAGHAVKSAVKPVPAAPAPSPAPPARELQEPAADTQPPSWQVPAALIIGGVGAAGLVTGVVSGLMAGSRYAKAERECPDHACLEGSAGWDAVQSFRTLRTVSTVGYIVGGVGLAAGTALFVMAPAKPARSARSGAVNVNVWVGPSSLGVAGAF